MGAVAKGGDKLDVLVTYKPEGHFTYGKCQVVELIMTAHCSNGEPY